MMSDEPQTLQADDETLNYWQQHKYLVLVGSVVVVSVLLTVISVVIYNVSGANQLDLSRPGYQSVSDQVQVTDNIDEYSATGSFNSDAAQEFIELYDAQAKKAKAVDAFNGDPLNPEVLEFGESTRSE